MRFGVYKPVKCFKEKGPSLAEVQSTLNRIVKHTKTDQKCQEKNPNKYQEKHKETLLLRPEGIRARLNCLPGAANGDMVLATLKKGKSEFCKQVMPAIVIRPRKTFRRKDDSFLYFEDNAGVIVKNKGEIKGSAITGPVSKECADLWPRIASQAEIIP
ncbi:RP-L23e [Lepeophtheirus salmonis]|uniref:Large ribosomal subunit protein uL14 n=1 Tax=Lepeophtheirus salmonis TaxID=72036 RepID=A0A7R8CIH9_LEPSM|nr:RP-L23e [Lepeophtheirus salmonis]CAF2832749.1 RP-L23e [Lepeophtheirus salmonis]